MSKVKRIAVENLKAIEKFEADFEGCTAILKGPNEKGKTTFLKGIIERIMFIRPDVIVHKGEEQGKGELILDTGERFVWEFDVKGKDKLWYYDKENIKHSVTVALGSKFFPKPFDVDKFLKSSPKEQSKQLQAIVGLDFTDIEKRYELAYNDRTEKNREAELHHVKLTKWEVPEKVDFISLDELSTQKETERKRLNELYSKNKGLNLSERNKWQGKCEKLRVEVESHNKTVDAHRAKYDTCFQALETLKNNGYKGSDALSFVKEVFAAIPDEKTYVVPEEPKYIEEMPDDKGLQAIDAKILQASEVNTKAQAYKDYIDFKEAVKNARHAADVADELVKSIEAERDALIQKGNFPEGITIDFNGMYLNGMPFNEKQVSKARLVITALKIAAMNIGEVKTLYFDASALDKKCFLEINEWAESRGFQLLIEKPSWDSEEFSYELIETIE